MHEQLFVQSLFSDSLSLNFLLNMCKSTDIADIPVGFYRAYLVTAPLEVAAISTDLHMFSGKCRKGETGLRPNTTLNGEKLFR